MNPIKSALLALLVFAAGALAAAPVSSTDQYYFRGYASAAQTVAQASQSMDRDYMLSWLSRCIQQSALWRIQLQGYPEAQAYSDGEIAAYSQALSRLGASSSSNTVYRSSGYTNPRLP